MRTTDLEHRLHVLYAWKEWAHVNTGDLTKGATYRAVLDGCGITVRTLCYAAGLRADFRSFNDSDHPNTSQARSAALLACCNSAGRNLLATLNPEEQRCLLEVIYFGNRAIAHADKGIPDHKVGPPEMTSARLTVINLLQADAKLRTALSAVNPLFSQP